MDEQDNYTIFRQEPTKQVKGIDVKVLHVGAVTNKLDKLKSSIETKFDTGTFTFEKEMFGEHRKENTNYIIKGSIDNVLYKVSLEHIECPTPILMAQVHHATISLPINNEDKITPIIKQAFQEYEVELQSRYE